MFAGQKAGVEQTDEHIWLVSFMHYDVGFFDDETRSARRPRDTRLGLEQAAAGQPPAISHYTIEVAPFDRGALETRVREAGGRVMTRQTSPTSSASPTTPASSLK